MLQHQIVWFNVACGLAGSESLAGLLGNGGNEVGGSNGDEDRSEKSGARTTEWNKAECEMKVDTEQGVLRD
jgi:hypothetical protein